MTAVTVCRDFGAQGNKIGQGCNGMVSMCKSGCFGVQVNNWMLPELHSKMNEYLLCGRSGTMVQTVSCGVIHRPELEPWLRNTACATLKLYDSAHIPYCSSHCLLIILKQEWGMEVGGGFRMGNTCTPMADPCQCMARTTTIL